MPENGLVRKQRLILKLIARFTGELIITTHILPNIARSKGKQTTEFGPLTEYIMKNVFLEKSYSKCGGETSSSHFSKTQT